MTEAECYIKIYGYSLFSCVGHYNVVRKYSKKLEKLVQNTKSRLYEGTSHESR